MTAFLSAIQYYPALNKLIVDLSSYVTGSDPAARDRIQQHKFDEKIDNIRLLIERSMVKASRDASTQTDTLLEEQ